MVTSIAQKLGKLLETKEAIKNALMEKGADAAAAPLGDYPFLISQISGGGGAAFPSLIFDNLSPAFYEAAALFTHGVPAANIDLSGLSAYEALVFWRFANQPRPAADVDAADLSPAERFKYLFFMLQKGADVLTYDLSELNAEQRGTLVIFSFLTGKTITAENTEGLGNGAIYTLLLLFYATGKTAPEVPDANLDAGQRYILVLLKLLKGQGIDEDFSAYPEGRALSLAAHAKTASANTSGAVKIPAPDTDFLPVLRRLTGEIDVAVEPEFLPASGTLTDWLKL
jgi:hypothetical protein